MTNARLLDRQVSLLAYLSSGDAIFGEGAPADPMLRGLDPARLRLEAGLSFKKRMTKIRATFPETFAHLKPGRAETLLSDFARDCPADDIGRYHNARQFLAYLEERWRSEPPEPPFLPDIARLELAIAHVRALNDDLVDTGTPDVTPALRRSPYAALVRCGHDVRAVFEACDGDGVCAAEAEPSRPRTPTWIVVAITRTDDAPRVFAVSEPVFDLLDALGRWTSVDAFVAAFGAKAWPIAEQLARDGIIEVRA